MDWFRVLIDQCEVGDRFANFLAILWLWDIQIGLTYDPNMACLGLLVFDNQVELDPGTYVKQLHILWITQPKRHRHRRHQLGNWTVGDGYGVLGSVQRDNDAVHLVGFCAQQRGKQETANETKEYQDGLWHVPVCTGRIRFDSRPRRSSRR